MSHHLFVNLLVAFLQGVIIEVFNLQDELCEPSQQTWESVCAHDGTSVVALERQEHVRLWNKRVDVKTTFFKNLIFIEKKKKGKNLKIFESNSGYNGCSESDCHGFPRLMYR